MHTPDPTPINMRELAGQLGLSVATVSRALRNHPNVSPDTKARVLAAARRVGYRPNALVNALMAQVRYRKREQPSGEVVSYLTSFATENDWRRHPSHAEQFEGARQRAEELGFTLQPMWLGDRCAHSRQLARVMYARGVRGSILAPVPVDNHTLELDWQHHAVVAIGYSFQQVALHRAVHDNNSMIAACYSQLRKLDCGRIALAMHQSDSARVRHLWTTGFLGAQWLHGGEAIPPLLFDRYDDDDAFTRWVEIHRPDAVIGVWQDVPLVWLRARGLRVPEDLCYATLDLGDRVGRLAGMAQDNHGIGAAAMDLLASQLFRNEIGIPATPKLTMIEGTWMDGPTVARQAQPVASTKRS